MNRDLPLPPLNPLQPGPTDGRDAGGPEKQIPASSRKGGLILAHNINPRMADPNYMKAITTDPNLETVVRGAMGITLKKN